jgi:hypothetical protein
MMTFTNQINQQKMTKTENNATSALSKITKGRTRTNILKKLEQRCLAYLVQRIPRWVSSDMLTALGLAGAAMTAVGFWLAGYGNRYWLFLGVAGFAINWFGDSLDGRVAYFRSCPRKWYGFSLDCTADWLTNIFIGLGYIAYEDSQWEILGFLFVVLYGWAMKTMLIRYKVTDTYTIDSGLLGPTEVRMLISMFLVLEVFVPGSLVITSGAACVILFAINVSDTVKLLKLANIRDENERRANG